VVSANGSSASLLNLVLFSTRFTRNRFLHAATRPFNPLPQISLSGVRWGIIYLLHELVCFPSLNLPKIYVNNLTLPQLCSRLGRLSNNTPTIAMSLNLHA